MLSQRDSLLEVLLEPVFIAAGYVADDGRPLAEITATQEAKKGVEFELRRCPYSGSRFEKTMNISALPGLSKEIKHVISDTIYFREKYFTHHKIDHFDLASFWLFTRVLDTLPIYLVRRANNPIAHDQLPARVSALFKAAQGLHLAPELLLIDGQSLEHSIGVSSILDFIENRGIYLDEDRACAGPLSMITAFTKSAIEGKGKQEPEFGMGQYLSDEDVSPYFDYSDNVSALFAGKITYEAQSRIRLEAILTSLGNDDFSDKAKANLDRFGSLKKRKADSLLDVEKHLLALIKKEQNVTTHGIDKTERLHKMLALRNPQLSASHLNMMIEALFISLNNDASWVRFFIEKQSAVLNALGYRDEQPAYTHQHLSGLSYSSTHILCKLLNIDILNSDESLIVKAGASSAEFFWQKKDD